VASALACTADASGRWKLLPKDFCKGLPQELGRLPGPKDRLPKDVPKPADCFCPTNSLEQRFNSDPRGFDRQLPAGAHPKVPKLKSATRCAPGRSFVTYQCTPRVPVDGGNVSEASALGPTARTVDVEPPKQQQQQRRRLWWRRIDHRI
jgi:hypothetical protein